MRTQALTAHLVGWLGTLVGCGGAEHQLSFTARDSSGVTIVESNSPAWAPEDAWQVAAHPTVSIGTADGPEEDQLFRVRGALRLDDGRIVIANDGSQQLKFYNPDGSFHSASGRQGGGPGEFVSMGRIWRLGDSLYVYDFQQGSRMSVFDLNGRFLRSFTLEFTSGGRLPVMLDVFPAGMLLVEAAARDAELTDGLSMDTSLFVTYTLDGREQDTIGWFPGHESYIRREQGRTASTGRPYGLDSQRAMTGQRMYFGSSATYEIGLYDAEGALERLIRVPKANPPVTSGERAEFEERLAERWSRMAPVWRAIYQQVELPDTKPAFGRLMVDADGNLWVAEYATERADLNRWDVFDPDGKWLGTVDTPRGLLIYQIGADYLLGLWRDELDVEYVRMHRIEKTER